MLICYVTSIKISSPGGFLLYQSYTNEYRASYKEHNILITPIVHQRRSVELAALQLLLFDFIYATINCHEALR